MSNLLKEKRALGVIIARMQVPYLTESHEATIRTVLDRHSRVVLFLGVNSDGITETNPYTFDFRKEMIRESFCGYNLNIIPLPDIKNDDFSWCNQIDRFVSSLLSNGEIAVLYGGRESFIPTYKEHSNKFETIELAPNDYDSGTNLRFIESIKQPRYTLEAAQAILFTINQLKNQNNDRK
jgi:hypothetical protein